MLNKQRLIDLLDADHLRRCNEIDTRCWKTAVYVRSKQANKKWFNGQMIMIVEAIVSIFHRLLFRIYIAMLQFARAPGGNTYGEYNRRNYTCQ